MTTLSHGTTTRAAIWQGGGHLELGAWPLPDLGADDVLVDVAGCGICGSDLHVLDGAFVGLRPPVVLGHEPVGTIAAVGSSVTAFAEGEVVTWEPNVACGHCVACRNGADVNLCEQRVRVSGSFATQTVVPAQALHRLPARSDRDAGVMAEPLSCALYAFERSGARLGDSIAIIGAGTIGLLLLLLARHSGAQTVLISDPNPLKRAAAQRLGGDRVVDPTVDDVAAAAHELTAGGPDIAFEAVGLPSTVGDTLRIVRPGGHAVLVGASRPGDRASIDLVSLQRRDLTISACWLRKHSFQRAVALLPALPVGELITHHVTLNDVEDGLQLLRTGAAIKVVVVPHG